MFCLVFSDCSKPCTFTFYSIFISVLYLKKLRDSDQTFARGAFTVTKFVFGGDSEMDMGSFFPPSDPTAVAQSASRWMQLSLNSSH